MTIAYTFIGGFLAVSWTDTVQATLMIFALLLVPVFAIIGVGGPVQALSLIDQVDPSRLDWFAAGGAMAILGVVLLNRAKRAAAARAVAVSTTPA